MNILIDTNIVIDVLIRRKPFYELSQFILLASEKKLINGYISAAAVTDIHYIIKKTTSSNNESNELLKKLVTETVEVAMVDADIIMLALDANWNDFEDCVQFYVGKSVKADYIVTRNPDDFIDESITVLTPEELLDLIAPVHN